jgi:peptidoglycan/LPS O-acetylase OafA/YrhL
MLRIVPLYYLVLLVFFILLPFILQSFISGSVNNLINQQAYYWTFTVNFYDAFLGWPANITLVPLWSLSCEMQFYLVWPFVIMFTYKQSKKFFVATLAGFILFAFLFRLYANDYNHFSAAYSYVLLPSRLDAFSIGALLYFFLTENKLAWFLHKAWCLSLLSLFFAVLILVYEGQGWHLDGAMVSKTGYTLNALFWAGLLGYAASGSNNAFAKIFKPRWLINAGKYSYAMYILHVPVKVFLLKFSGEPALSSAKYYIVMLAAALFTLALSFASFHLLEKRLLQFKTRI